jgi:restriction system protein
MDLVAMLPWWVGVALALVSYLLLHHLASKPLLHVAQVGPQGSVLVQTLWVTLAGAGQYFVPFICLCGVGMSAWRRRTRSALINAVVQADAANAIDGLSWREFEMLVGEAFRLQGFQVLETGGGGADGGVDLVLGKPGSNGSEKFLVQCKQWRALKVGVDVARELYGVMAARGATGGFLVTSGRFTDEAIRFAAGRNLELIDGPKLCALIQKAKEARGTTQRSPLREPVNAHLEHSPAPSEPTSCPICAKPMVRRTAKRGANSGNAFWGCTAYPACRGTRPAA